MKLATTFLTAAAVTLGLSSASLAADLIVEPPAYVEPVVVGSNWDGGYVGVFAGGGWASVDFSDDYYDYCYEYDYMYGDDCSFDLGGWLIGLNAGYNFSVGEGFVLGIAGDIAWADLGNDDDDDFDEYLDFNNSMEWEASLRGVLGWDGGYFMPYLTGGVAFAGVSHEADYYDWFWEDSTTYVGGTFGAGVMFAVAENIALDLQYRHSWYSGETLDWNWDDEEFDFGDPAFDLQTDRFTVGVNFTF